MCEILGCPRRVVSYKEKGVGDASKARSVNIPPKKVLNACSDQCSALHNQGPKHSREIHASNRNHIATAKVEVVVFESLDVIETAARISKCRKGIR
jgi:hypothetical protein